MSVLMDDDQWDGGVGGGWRGEMGMGMGFRDIARSVVVIYAIRGCESTSQFCVVSILLPSPLLEFRWGNLVYSVVTDLALNNRTRS